MGFRIEVKKEAELTVLYISGILAAPAILELDRLCKSTLGPLCIDLADLQSIEAEGAEFIRNLEGSGVTLRSVSPYIRLLLH